MDKYYNILGLQPGATKADIKRAYRLLAFKYHPDVNPDPTAKDRFLLVSEAYNYLMNPPKYRGGSASTKSKADAERVKRAKAAATAAARQRYAAFKKQQEEEQGKAYSRAIASLIAIILLIGAIYFGSKYINIWYVNQDKAETIGTLYMHKTRNFWVSYKVEGEEYIKKYSGTRSKFLLLTPNGMPCIDGSEFLVYYRKENPKRCYLDYDRITPTTLDLYLDMIAFELGKRYKITKDDARLECLALMVFGDYGIEGLADLFFWNEPMAENLSNNSYTFSELEEEELYQKHLLQCRIKEDTVDVDEQ